MAGEPFNFWNNRTATDLDSLISVLSDMSYEEFSHYVNESKNDFASWIEYSLENKVLADKIRHILEKDLIRATIVDFLNSKNDKLIIGTAGRALQEDSLIKEIMQKNEDFFKEIRPEHRMQKVYEHERAIAQENKSEEANQESSNTKQNEGVNPLVFGKSLDDVKSELNSFQAQASKSLESSKSKRKSNRELFIGLCFGIVMGVLLTLIALQLLKI